MASPTFVVAASVAPASASASASPGLSRAVAPPTFAAAILVDADTGRVLYESNAHTPLPPGSLTKTLTAMIAADWLPPTAQVPVTTAAFNAYPDKVGMKPGQKWPLGIVMHALITDSANDAAYALAIDIAGSLQAFPAVMQSAGRQIGLSDHPVLEDPAGLDGTEGVDGGNRISAWDLAVMGRDMMANPVLSAIALEQTYDFEGPDGIAYHIVSRNLHFLLSYPGAIGIKTGFTDAAGYCSMEEAVRDGRHMVAVVLHSNNPDAVAADLITHGFATTVSSEAAHPLLPRVTQPEPVPPPPAASPPSSPPSTAGLKVAALRPGRSPAGASHGWIEVLGAAGVVAGVGVWTRRWVRRRPDSGAHSRRRGRSGS